MEGALREALRDHEETAGNGRSQAFSLQRQLEAEKEQRLLDISRTTQTHATLLSDATESIKRLEVQALALQLFLPLLLILALLIVGRPLG